MGGIPTQPLAEAVEAMIHGFEFLALVEPDATDGPAGRLIIRATASMVADALAAVEPGKRRELATDAIAKAIALDDERPEQFRMHTRIRDDAARRVQVAVDALVGVHPYA